MSKRFVFIVTLSLFAFFADAQYYFRGEIRDVQKQPLSNVRMNVQSTNGFYYSGSTGAFGIPSSLLKDSVTLFLNGYEEKKILLSSDTYNVIELKLTAPGTAAKKKQLLSVTQDKTEAGFIWSSAGGETYTQQVENTFNPTAEFPSTSFALDVDKASYSNIRRFINMNSAVPTDAVRIEEMLNYFPLPYKQPPPGKTVSFESKITACPWNNMHHLMYIRMHAKKVNYDHLPPANLVLLIDVSGSMDLPNRLPLLKTAFRMMVQNLRPVDTISIVVYGGTVGVLLQPTSGLYQEKIMGVIDSLQAGGDTPGESALRMAYNIAHSKFIKGGNNRIILATDGDFNVGEINDEALVQLVTQKQQTGIYLTCLGVGMGNYKDSRLELLAKKGNGNFAYLDNVMEAEKVLVTELMQTLFAVADEAYLNVKFNPKYIKQYRLIGYDNRKDALADSTSLLEGGEIGTGYTVTAVFEIEPTGAVATSDDWVADAELNYQLPNTEKKLKETYFCPQNYSPLSEADSCYRFATGVVWFGLLLKQSANLPKPSWDEFIKFLPTCINPADYWQAEMLQLANKAKLIYEPVKRKGFLNRKKTSE